MDQPFNFSDELNCQAEWLTKILIGVKALTFLEGLETQFLDNLFAGQKPWKLPELTEKRFVSSVQLRPGPLRPSEGKTRRDSVTRFSTSGFFHESVSPSP
jgi:hypothetical protein